MSKKKKADWSQNLDLETLIARNSWATVEEMQSVIPYHLTGFKDILSKCQVKDEGGISITDLTFATRFVITYLFLNVNSKQNVKIH